MEFIQQAIDLGFKLFDFFLHLDKYLGSIISTYGTLTYFILFAVIFCETGLVVTPFLPGDSLLFTVGTFSALGALDITTVSTLLVAAAIIGDNLNYWIGRYVGPKVFSKESSKLLNKKHLEKTKLFFEKYGTKAIIIARFMPIIRTFTPFIAGVGAMYYPKFLVFDIIGGLVWVLSFTLGGYFFGNIPVVKQNFTIVIMAIIIISVMPAAIEFFKAWRANKKTKN